LPSNNLDRDAWLTTQLGYPAYQVKEPSLALTAHDLPSGKVFIGAKVETSQRDGLGHLQVLGFRVITVNLKLVCKALTVSKKINRCRARLASLNDETAVRKIARQSFTHDRFHADRNIPRPIADRIKEQWAASYFEGRRGDALFVAEDESRVIGFLLAIKKECKGFIIDLIAIEEKFQGRGLGAALILCANDHFSSNNTGAEISVGTQVTNMNSLRFYQRAGFTPIEAYFMLHLHNT
jgi:ribosomal protein S18 acetylase RimI-like enzyme